jgi:hypothetical protein
MHGAVQPWTADLACVHTVSSSVQHPFMLKLLQFVAQTRAAHTAPVSSYCAVSSATFSEAQSMTQS